MTVLVFGLVSPTSFPVWLQLFAGTLDRQAFQYRAVAYGILLADAEAVLLTWHWTDGMGVQMRRLRPGID